MTRLWLVGLLLLMALPVQARPRSVHFMVDQNATPTGRIDVRFVTPDRTTARVCFTLEPDSALDSVYVVKTKLPWGAERTERQSRPYIHRVINMSYAGVQFTPAQLAKIRQQLVAHQLPMDTDHPLALYLQRTWFRTRVTSDTTNSFNVHMRVPGHTPWLGRGTWVEMK